MTSRTDIEGSPVLTGPWPDPVVPGISLPEVLLATAAEHAERPALIDASSGRTLHYGELADGLRRVASGPVIRHGGLALTSTRLPGGGATVEVGRRQADGSWRWVIDQPALLS